jgi:hypothetical protein
VVNSAGLKAGAPIPKAALEGRSVVGIRLHAGGDDQRHAFEQRAFGGQAVGFG